MDNLKPGLRATSELLVGPEHTAESVGSGKVGVLATPVMINVIEAAVPAWSRRCCAPSTPTAPNSSTWSRP